MDERPNTSWVHQQLQTIPVRLQGKLNTISSDPEFCDAGPTPALRQPRRVQPVAQVRGEVHADLSTVPQVPCPLYLVPCTLLTNPCPVFIPGLGRLGWPTVWWTTYSQRSSLVRLLLWTLELCRVRMVRLREPVRSEVTPTCAKLREIARQSLVAPTLVLAGVAKRWRQFCSTNRNPNWTECIFRLWPACSVIK